MVLETIKEGLLVYAIFASVIPVYVIMQLIKKIWGLLK